MSVLVLAEHDNASVKDATLNAVTAAKALAGFAGGDVHVLVAGKGAQAAADAAAKIDGVAKVLLADDAAFGDALAENVAPLIAGLLGFGGIAGTSAGIAQVLFLVFIVLFVIAMIARAMRGRPPI